MTTKQKMPHDLPQSPSVALMPAAPNPRVMAAEKRAAEKNPILSMWSRPVARGMIKRELKASKRQKEGVATHWTYMQCMERFSYGGFPALFAYKAEVKKCGAKQATIDRIDNVIRYLKPEKAE